MKRGATLIKLIIVLLAIGGVGFCLHAISKAQPTTEFIHETQQIDLRLVREMDISRTEIGEPEPSMEPVLPEQVHDWLTLLHAEHDGSLMFTDAITNLERLLNRMTPSSESGRDISGCQW